MKLLEQLEKAKYLFLINLLDEEYNYLTLIISEGKVVEKSSSGNELKEGESITLDELIARSDPIIVDDKCKTYQLT